MAKEVKQAVAEPEVNTAEWLEQKMAKMKEAQKIFATYTQEQVDKIFFEAAGKDGSRRDRNGNRRR